MRLAPDIFGAVSHPCSRVMVDPKMHPAVVELCNRDNEAQRTEGWHRMRKGMLTASDVAAALGMNPYKSRAVLMKEKCCKEERRNEGSAATDHGNKYEDEAIEIYEQEFNKKAMRFGLFPSLEHKWLGGSPDGVTTDGILLEVKWYGI